MSLGESKRYVSKSKLSNFRLTVQIYYSTQAISGAGSGVGWDLEEESRKGEKKTCKHYSFTQDFSISYASGLYDNFGWAGFIQEYTRSSRSRS